MKIGSLGGATIDSALNHMEANNQPDYFTKQVIYHLGTNNIRKDDEETIIQKIDKLVELAARKYPNAKIGICKIPETSNEEWNKKINKVNEYISREKENHFIHNDVSTENMVKDKIHYNKRGLAVLAKSIKTWSRWAGANRFQRNFYPRVNYYNEQRLTARKQHEPRYEYFESGRRVFDYGHGMYQRMQEYVPRQYYYNRHEN